MNDKEECGQRGSEKYQTSCIEKLIVLIDICLIDVVQTWRAFFRLHSQIAIMLLLDFNINHEMSYGLNKGVHRLHGIQNAHCKYVCHSVESMEWHVTQAHLGRARWNRVVCDPP